MFSIDILFVIKIGFVCSVKEVTALKRKLEQVSQFGCIAFALLFDDIEPEMSEADKEVFQSFAHAQVCFQLTSIHLMLKLHGN